MIFTFYLFVTFATFETFETFSMPHIPVLMKEVLEYLNPQPNQNFIDCTLGDGGHTFEILKRTAPNGKLLGIDLDQEAIKNVERGMLSAELKNLQERLILVNDNFKNLASIVTEKNFHPVHGILLDLGFSTSTLERGRGFSFEKDEPLDMRFNQKGEHLTAAEIVNGWDKKQLEEILTEYGEEPQAKLIAEAIVYQRRKERIYTTEHLVKVILDVYRAKLKSKKEVPWIGGIHPATRTFQALRLAVNDELRNLQAVLPEAMELLEPGGRLAVISFHSLEDRIVKYYFKGEAGKLLEIETKKPIIASDEENASNPKARSAKLRVAERLVIR